MIVEIDRPASSAARRERGGKLSMLAAVLLVFGGAIFGAASTASAQARMHQITWAHATPGAVQRFVVLISPTEGDIASARQIDLGMPQAESAGSLSVFSAMVSLTDNEFLSVAAVGHNGQMSIPSDWTLSPPTRPGQPLLVEP